MNDEVVLDIKDKTVNRLLKKGKLRGRIDAMCCSCIYDPIGDGSWRLQAERCTSMKCPLYAVRPVTIHGTRANEGKLAISAQINEVAHEATK